MLRRPLLSLGAMVALLAVAIFAFRFIPNIFFPDNDRPLMVAELAFPYGTAIEHTDSIVRSYFGFMTLLGIISLSGIVINNAIVLLDRIQFEIDENGHAPLEAIIQAAQRRLRPILLTTATTAGGLLPLWLGGGSMFEPMAIAILFGLVFGTALTLGLVPILYSLFYRVQSA